jgi:hypothetical protein
MVLVLSPDGTGHALYDEKIDLNTLGPLHIERATIIEYDDRTQCWQVQSRDGKGFFSNASRQTCLDWERKYYSNPYRLIKQAGKGGA